MSLNYLEQIDLLTTCIYRESGKVVTALCPTAVYNPQPMRLLAEQVYAYIDEHGTPPGDLFVNMILDLKERHGNDAEVYDQIRQAVNDARDTVNEDYTLQKLRRFMRSVNVQNSLVKIIALHNAGDDSQAIQVMLNAANARDITVDPGLDLNTLKRFVGPQHKEYSDTFSTGIDILDRCRITPARKEMLMAVAPAKKGKTQCMVHVGRAGILMRKKVCHVTLEMPEEQILERYLRSLTAMGDDLDITRSILHKDDNHRFVRATIETLPNPCRFGTDEGDAKINAMLHRFKGRLPLKIKEFPSGKLSINGLRKWLRSLESVHNYVPDLLLVDYPDLMRDDQINQKDYRIQLDNIIVGLRGIAGELNCAVMVASQTNRAASIKKNVRGHDVGESFGKIMTFDKGIFYSQTDYEQQQHLARLYYMGRNVRSSQEILISQCYDTCTFATDSAYIDSESYPPQGSPDRQVTREREHRGSSRNGSTRSSSSDRSSSSTTGRYRDQPASSEGYSEFDRFSGRETQDASRS